MLYSGDFYLSPFYLEGITPPPEAIPVDLRYYRTDIDGVYVFHWGFDEAYISPSLSSLDFDLQIDTINTFDSSNLQTFTSTTAISYQNGNVRKGFAINVASRLDFSEQTWYARVRTRSGVLTSEWSDTLTWTILQKWEQGKSERIIENLPDFHVYNKQDLLRPTTSRNTNLYVVAQTYGQEFDKVELENALISTDNYISSCRDESLYNNFGVSFKYQKPTNQQFVEYRMCLLNLLLASMDGSTANAVKKVVKSFTGVDPDLRLIRDREDSFISSIQEIPPQTPNGSITFFSTSSDYIPGTLVVLKNGVRLAPGIDYTENHNTYGYTMSVAPLTGNTLVSIFEIGQRGDPEFVVFDPSIKTAIAGTVTFTNGSRSITGSGTAFTTALQEGRLITDVNNLYYNFIREISSNTSAELASPWLGPTQTVTAYVISHNGSTILDGTTTFTNGSVVVTGVGTSFSTQLTIGDVITDNSGTVVGVVSSILSNTYVTLSSPWGGSTSTTTNARKFIYSIPIVWDNLNLAHGLVIRILNPGEFTLNEDLIKSLVNQILPAHIKVYYDFSYSDVVLP